MCDSIPVGKLDKSHTSTHSLSGLHAVRGPESALSEGASPVAAEAEGMLSL